MIANIARQTLALLMIIFLALPPTVIGQQTGASVLQPEELDQVLATIALYPDSLLAQVRRAATYPADVAEAVAWSKAHPDEKGDTSGAISTSSNRARIEASRSRGSGCVSPLSIFSIVIPEGRLR